MSTFREFLNEGKTVAQQLNKSYNDMLKEEDIVNAGMNDITNTNNILEIMDELNFDIFNTEDNREFFRRWKNTEMASIVGSTGYQRNVIKRAEKRYLQMLVAIFHSAKFSKTPVKNTAEFRTIFKVK